MRCCPVRLEAQAAGRGLPRGSQGSRNEGDSARVEAAVTQGRA